MARAAKDAGAVWRLGANGRTIGYDRNTSRIWDRRKADTIASKVQRRCLLASNAAELAT